MYTVLYVDDEPALLELGRLFLEKNGQLDVETCLSASSALEALRCRHYDAIVSDYQMPGMDGIGFLKAVRSQFGDIPFILFTGKGREEVAIAAINNGVNFYLQKGGDPGVQFAELEHDLLQAVLRREAEQSLRRSEERYRSVVDDQTEMIARFTGDGTITFINESYRSYFAPLLDLGEIVGRNIRELMQIRNYSEVEAFLASFTPDSPIREMERAVIGRDGKRYFQRYSVRALFGDGEAPAEFQVVGRDVTAEMLAEQAVRLRESRLRFMLGFYEMARQPEERLLEYAVEGAGIVTDSPLGYLAFLNPDESELTMHAWSRSAMEECALRKKPIVYKTEKTGLWGESVRQRRPVITNDYPAPNPLKKGHPEGHTQILRHMNIPIMDGDRIVIVAGVANKETPYSESDVSELSLLMQGLWQVLKGKRTEESLRESEEKYRLATETTGQLVYDYDIPSGRIRWSGAIEQVTGWTPEEFQEVDIAAWEERIHPDDRKTALAELKASMERAGEYLVEYRFRRKDGTYIPMEDTSAFITDAAGRARRMVGTQKDLSRRRQVEEALRLSEERYRGMADRISDIVFLVDRDLRLTYISPSFESLTGLSALPLLGGPLPLGGLRTEERERMEDVIRRNRALEPAGPLEITCPAKGGRSIILELHTTPILEDGRLAGVQVIAHDITRLREAQDELRGAYEQLAATEEELRAQFELLAWSEQQLRESDARFRAIFDHASAALTLSDGEWQTCLAANPAFERITGCTVAEAIGRNATDLMLIAPELGERLARELRDRGSIDTFPITFTRPDGEERQGLLSSIPISVDDRPAILTLVVDITDQYRATAAQRESEERLRSLFEAMIEAVFITDEEGLIVEWNPAAERISGLPRAEVLGTPAWEVLVRFLLPEQRTEENRARFEALIREGLRTGAPFFPTSRNIEIERPDGTRAVLRQAVFSMPAPGGFRFGSIALDITDQLRAEEVLRESEQRFRRLFEQIPLGIALVGSDLRFRSANPALCRMLEYSAEELVGRTFSSVTYPEDVALGLAETTRDPERRGVLLPDREAVS